MAQEAARVSVIIPALNEGDAIGNVVRGLTAQTQVREVVVVDNGSTDETAVNAAAAGARVLSEPRRGYGRACASGFAACNRDCDVIVFVDGDGSDRLEDLSKIVNPVLHGEADFVVGSRTRGEHEPGSLLLSQRIAGRMAGLLLRLRYGVCYTDMGPFRAIERSALERLRMREMTYGWNLEMQMKAAQERLRIREIPVGYRHRQGGVSKVSGSFQGSIKAAIRIASVFVRVAATRAT